MQSNINLLIKPELVDEVSINEDFQKVVKKEIKLEDEEQGRSHLNERIKARWIGLLRKKDDEQTNVIIELKKHEVA